MGNIAAFDIGGTFVKHGVISENGEVFFSKEYKTHAEKGGKWIIENLCAIVCELMKKQEISGDLSHPSSNFTIFVVFNNFINEKNTIFCPHGNLPFCECANRISVCLF